MTLHITNYTIPLAIILSFLVLGIFYIFIYRKGPQDTIGVMILVLSIIWIASLLLEQSFESYQLKILWNKIQYTGSTLLPVGVFLLTAQYTGFKKLLEIKNIIIVSIFPIITLFLVLTNELHNLIWRNAKLVVFSSFSMVIKEYNTFYFIFSIYTHILILAGIIMVIQNIIESFKKLSRKMRWKNLLLIPYISVPWLIILIKTLGFNPFPTLEEAPIITAISTLVIIAILNRTKIREIMPMAFNTIFESMRDGLILSDGRDNVIKINPASQKIFDISINKVFGKPVENLLLGFNNSSESKMPLENEEIKISTNGNQYYYNINQSEIKSDRGKYMGKLVVLRDVTKIKKAEENIKYLSFHDKLTQLYNRAYFDIELKRLDTERQLPLSLIIGDINGLKIINDAFGHNYGDKLLIRIADILKECFRKEDIVARWGGDEFSAILPQTSLDKTMNIVNRVYTKCRENSTDTIPLSMSMGAATKESMSENIKNVIKKAEDRMYKHKLIENKSVRSSIITSLEKALAERDYETEEHTRRMKKYAILFGKALKLPDSKLDELSLLSTLHDIGKIAIPDNIILKPAELTEKERELIKKHSEIGYRIAMSTAELAPIADAILHHHERWDGNGYPYGLKGEKIPLTSRIIFIVDAYDAITNDRPYRKASSKEFALSEINRCSGLQFDPNITGIFINQVIHEGSNIKYYMKVEKQKANSVSKSF